MPERPSAEEIRALVRAVLREALPAGAVPAKADGALAREPAWPAAQPAAQGPSLAQRLREGAHQGGTVEVPLDKDGDLTRFAVALAEAAGNHEVAAALANGKLKLRAAGRPSVTDGRQRRTGKGGNARSGEMRIDKGVVNETKVAEIARSHARLVLGAGAVVTPLAKDRAREAKLDIVRWKS